MEYNGGKFPPTIKGASEEVKVREGNGKSIRCEVEGSPTPHVDWRKNGAPYDAPLSHVANNIYSIHLQRATVADSGVYTCVASNSAGERRKEFRVNVLVPPKIDEGERVLKVRENGSVTLECIASGVPPPTITWSRDSRVVSSSPKLELTNVETQDAGRYTCEARNEADINHADFVVDVLVKPKFRPDIKSEIRVIEGEKAMLECRADGKPTPAIRWMRGGRPITDSANVILSPRSESLMILHTRKSDAGLYSCVVTNAAGQSEATFKVTVLSAPHIDETIDQNPRVIHNRPIVLQCPVLGNPDPTVEWRRDGALIVIGDRVTIVDKKHLKIDDARTEDAGRYTCHAQNEVSYLDTDYMLEVIAPPKFGDAFGKTEHEVLKGSSVTMTCPVRVDQTKDINWLRGSEPIYLSENVKISSDAHKLTIESVDLSDGGKYACRASNEAGSTEVHLILKVLVPPEIDKSNIIQNPLAIVGRSISLECPVKGIPQPTILWMRDNIPMDVSQAKYYIDQNNQTFVIDDVQLADEGSYSCFVENRGGSTKQDFNLGVLIPPQMETNETQKLSRREGSLMMLVCPVQRNPSEDTAGIEISWLKDERPLDPISSTRLNLTDNGRRLIVPSASLADAGNYACIASNQAGEVLVKFEVVILSVPSIENSRNDPKPRVIEGRPITLWCEVSGYPFPTVRWSKNGVEVTIDPDNDHLRLLDQGQGLEIFEATPQDAGQWMCTAENDAGATEMILNLNIWEAPQITVTTLDGKRSAISQSGSQVTLICNATGNPPPSLSWSFGGQLLIPSADGARISSKGGRLDIPHLKENDAGEYTCSARNEVGSVEGSIDVDILIPPVIYRNQIDLNPRIPTGRSLTLVCEATGKPNPQFVWLLNNAPLTNSSTAIFSDDSKYLQLRNISLKDKGIYVCEAKNDAGQDQLMYKLDVDQIPSISNGGTVQVTEGQITEMVCQAQGEPAPVISWQRNGVRVETGIRYIAEGNVLKVIDTRTADSGIYVCVATNEAGIDQQAFTLEVQVPPRITITSPAESMVPVGSPFSLKCGSSGSPPPFVSWYINDAPIESVYSDDQFTLADDGTLFIPRPAERGALPFKCVVKNDAGIAEMEYIVKVISPPTVTREGLRTINTTENDASVISCDVEGEDPDILWRKDNKPLAVTEQMKFTRGRSMLEITQTKLHDEGLYTCVVANSAGNASQSTQLFVGVPPTISEKSRRVIVQKGQNAELWCEAVGIPPPQISWLKDSTPLSHTAVDDHTERIQTTAIFNGVTLDQAGIYTCTAKNWAGSVYKDVDLVVLVPPEIYPEKVNMTANINETIILPCNASGIPEPVVSWVKIPDVDISGHAEKYQILGTALAIKNVGPDDDGFYHCIAKSDAGQAIGSRRLNVALPKKDQKINWVECDDEGKPIKKTYAPSRGDSPQGTLVPWATIDYLDLPFNGSNGVIIRCLPGNRGPRRVPLLSVPHFLDTPRSHTVVVGQVLQLYCSATGTPDPEIMWMKDNVVIDAASSGEGSSLLRIEVVGESVAGGYTCVARNSLGSSTTMATVTVIPEPKKKTLPDKRQVTVMLCSIDGVVSPIRPDWVVDGRRIDENEGIQFVHAMNNGSLVLLGNAEDEDESVIECFVDGKQGIVASSRKTIDERAPRAVIRPARIYSRPGKTILIDCKVKYANLLTTEVRWTKDNVNLDGDGARVQILPNNSLWISEVRHTDQANYKCRASNRLGKSWDGVDVIVDDGARGSVGILNGVVNRRKVTHQNLVANVTPSIGFNTIHMKIDNLYGNHDTVTKALIGYMSAPVGFLGYDPDAPRERNAGRGNFERFTEYRFETGETINVMQKGKGIETENSHLEVDVLLNGNVPRPVMEDVLSIADSFEELIEEVPGRITGRGKSAIQFGERHRIPFEWSDKINYDPTDGMEIGAGKTMRVEVKSNFDHDELQMHTKVDRDERCPEGYHKIRGYCKDVDECAMDEEICGEESECVNTVGSYECERQCPPGFKTKWDGSCMDIDECSLGTASCPYETECLNTIGSFKCLESCATGYELDADDQCQDIDECSAQTSPCKVPMSCKNTLGSYRCVCPAGFPVVDGKCHGINAESDRPLQSISFESPSGGDCPPGFHWTGFVCEDVNECAFDAPCQYECENTVGSYKCYCPEGYLLNENGKCIDVDECTVGVCTASQLCFNELGSFKCLNSPCPQGYHLNNMRCVSNCANCSHSPIAVHMLAVPRRIPKGTPLLRLTSYDNSGRVLHRTRFNLAPKARANFALTMTDGKATLLNAANLLPASRHSIGIRSFSASRDKKYQSDFLVLLSVSKYDF
ncbi:hypothetical protein L596_014894 [Steinernema carpocapsae]|uniref:Uncharacterized protein n=2 Tax=Steinernema carpocapsae TaxID=34508 RepID=A0A4U5NDJ3_STECR|nr:hypothetical protein L596_014894 [Steinernema carpocapsae]